ncbi:uncharacterized [Tachysurus ichikawai]
MLKVERLEGYTEVFGFEKALDAIELLERHKGFSSDPDFPSFTSHLISTSAFCITQQFSILPLGAERQDHREEVIRLCWSWVLSRDLGLSTWAVKSQQGQLPQRAWILLLTPSSKACIS